MTSAIESALKIWLANEGFTASTIYTGFTGERQPNDSQTITVFVSDSNHVVGDLYKPTVNFFVATPPHHDDNPATSLSTHQTTVNTLRQKLQSLPESFKTDLEANSDLYYRGHFLQGRETPGLKRGDGLQKWNSR